MRRTLSLGAALLALSGCDPQPPTAVVAAISASAAMLKRSDFQFVRVDVERGSSPKFSGLYPGSQLARPGTLTLHDTGDGDSLTPVRVVVSGFATDPSLDPAAQPIITRSIKLSFVAQKTKLVRMGLSVDCVGKKCEPGSTCDRGGCISEIIETPEILPDFTEDTPTFSCGDGLISGEGAEQEECDGDNLGGQTCATATGRADAQGKLSCTPACKLEASACTFCGDGKKNGSEECEGADLGGQGCAAGESGQVKCTPACKLDRSGCQKPPTSQCSDGKKNGSETDTDCGGVCSERCAEGQGCKLNEDCAQKSCVAGKCQPQPQSCTDKVKNGGESDVDCGSACTVKCGDGQACNAASDCFSAFCAGGVCKTPTCSDGVKNGNETDTDCGATCPEKCADGKVCIYQGDCKSGVCLGDICQQATCKDGLKNGAETGSDCGGPCSPCSTGQGCLVASDCQSSVCSGGQCVSPGCVDGAKNGFESDVDCGGFSCVPCGDGQSCQIGGDCKSGVCTGDKCQAPACDDNVSNGTETDLDCGGGQCAPCLLGRTCVLGSDCESKACLAGKCVSPDCLDGAKNGDESDVDCGGSCAIKCAPGQGCSIGEDCDSQVCKSNTCQKILCGDGVAQAGEQCDDGNADDTDACLSTCKNATCGDGVVQAGVEQCDDGNNIENDACTSACKNFCSGPGDLLGLKGECYRELSGLLPWEAARQACMAEGPGFELATLSSLEEINFARSNLTKKYWIGGLRDTFAPGFRWFNGEPFVFSDHAEPWTSVAEPTGDGNCLEFYSAGLNDLPCDKALLPLCERPPVGSPLCRDSKADAPEECDDGNLSDTDACTSLCKNAACGDGFIGPGETCDDGVYNNDASSCTSSCKKASCGDGLVFVNQEECDDGNQTNTDDCINCVTSKCGDGFTQAGVEECDDGNQDDTDGCTNACTAAKCGDGFVQAGVEECDGIPQTDCATWLGIPGSAGQLGCDASCKITIGSCKPPQASCNNLTSQCAGSINCCSFSEIPGGTATFGDAGYTGATPTFSGTVQTFKLDLFEVNVGRFREFYKAYNSLDKTRVFANGAAAHPLNSQIAWDAGYRSWLKPKIENYDFINGCSDYPKSHTWTTLKGANEFKPMNCVPWELAFAFCTWDGGRLPTSIEWEYAARGGNEQRNYPWVGIWDPAKAVHSCNPCGPPSQVPNVGSKPLGVAKWGQYDMAGSVWEWVFDTYADGFYGIIDGCSGGSCFNTSPNPNRINRGGGFYISSNPDYQLHNANLNYSAIPFSATGFRCARD